MWDCGLTDPTYLPCLTLSILCIHILFGYFAWSFKVLWKSLLAHPRSYQFCHWRVTLGFAGLEIAWLDVEIWNVDSDIKGWIEHVLANEVNKPCNLTRVCTSGGGWGVWSSFSTHIAYPRMQEVKWRPCGALNPWARTLLDLVWKLVSFSL